MPFERSLEIENRLGQILHLIRTGSYSTPSLAAAVGTSIPTISRCVQALRERGHSIRAEKDGNGWRYVLQRTRSKKKRSRSTQPNEATN